MNRAERRRAPKKETGPVLVPVTEKREEPAPVDPLDAAIMLVANALAAVQCPLGQSTRIIQAWELIVQRAKS